MFLCLFAYGKVSAKTQRHIFTYNLPYPKLGQPPVELEKHIFAYRHLRRQKNVVCVCSSCLSILARPRKLQLFSLRYRRAFYLSSTTVSLTFGDGITENVSIIRSGYSSRILEINKVPIPDPVPPPRECTNWNP